MTYRFKPNPAWKARPAPSPWQPEEEAELIQMARCGPSVDYYKTALPNRTLGDILEKRLQLREAGLLQHARSI